MFYRTLITSALLLAASQASAMVMTADSDLKDWLAAVPTGSVNDWNTRADEPIKYMMEDQTGNNDFLDPGWGGQDYDAEAIYVNRTKTHINIAVVTGRAPDAGGYVAGDIAIDFGLDGVWDIGIVTLGDSAGIGSAGDIYAVTEWDYGLWVAPGVTGNANNAFKLSHPTTVAAGTKLGEAEGFSYDDFAYDGTSGLALGEHGDAGKHYVIEVSLKIDLIDPTLSTESFLVHWTMTCANDFVEVDPPAGVPSPAPLALLLMGLLPLARRVRNAD
jgi:hypothetical protein